MTGIQKKCAVQQSYRVHFTDFDVYLFNSYVEFVDSSSKLNDSENYPQLMAMCKTSGVRVTKVVFRGYFAAPKIQASHDQAISRRTDLQLKVCCSQTPWEVFQLKMVKFVSQFTLSQKSKSHQRSRSPFTIQANNF